MVMSMVNLPKEARSVLVVVIEKENFERMQKADPISLESERFGGGLPVPMFPLNFSVLICYEEDQAKLHEVAENVNKTPNGMKALFDYLERGREFIEGKDGVEHFRKV